jgi:serine/threonine-protein kinase
LTVGIAVGTPSYMAPEQTLEDGIIDGRTDIYAVGLLLFEMLSGRKPFVSDNVAQLLLMRQRQPAPRMGADATGAGFSEALEAFVAKALARTPSDRFSSADEMAQALELLPERTAQHAGTAATLVAPLPVDAGTSAAADLDKTLSDKTLIDAHPFAASVASLAEAEERAPRRLSPSFWKTWSRRRWLVATAVGATLGAVCGSLLLSTHKATNGPEVRKVPSPDLQQTPRSMDELSPMSPDGTPGLAEAAQLVRLGLSDQAITVLQDIRRNYPLSAYANFLLAVTYFDKMWWSIGREHAQAAMNLDPAYRRSPKLAKVFIRSLMSESFREKAAAILEEDLAEIAPPYLQEAAQYDRSARVRARAAQILANIAARTHVVPPSGSRGP